MNTMESAKLPQGGARRPDALMNAAYRRPSANPLCALRIFIVLAASSAIHAQSTTGIYVSSNNNVGIGTTAPTRGILHVAGGRINLEGNSGDAAAVMTLGNATYPTAQIVTPYGGGTLSLEGASGKGLLIDASGKVGIGTTSPSYALDVSSTIPSTSRVYIHPANGSEYALLQFSNSGGTSYFGMDESDGRGLGSGTAYALTMYAPNVPIVFSTSGGERMRINPGGNVGIGTANPVAIFHIHGNYNNDGSGGFLLDATDDGDPNKYSLRINPFVVGGAEVGYQFQTTSSSGGTNVPLTFDNAGNVGIATTSPVAPLDVSGILHVSGNTSPSLPTQGGYLGWNALTGGTGEMDFINQQGGGSGGFAFFNSGSNSAGSAIVTIDGSGSIFANEFIAASGNVYPDFVFKPGYKLPSLSDEESAIKKDGHLPGIPSEAEAKAHGINLADMQVKLLQKIEELTLHQIEQQKLLEQQNNRLDEQSQRIEQLEKENTELRTQH